MLDKGSFQTGDMQITRWINTHICVQILTNSDMKPKGVVCFRGKQCQRTFALSPANQFLKCLPTFCPNLMCEQIFYHDFLLAKNLPNSRFAMNKSRWPNEKSLESYLLLQLLVVPLGSKRA